MGSPDGSESAWCGTRPRFSPPFPVWRETPFFTDRLVRDYASATSADTGRYARFFRGMLERGVYPPPSQFEACFVSLAHMELRFPPVAQFLERFRALLARRSVFDFDAELDGLSRAEQAIAFLALLDLRRSDEIRISQAAPFAPIRVSKVEQESAAVNERTHAWTVRSA